MFGAHPGWSVGGPTDLFESVLPAGCVGLVGDEGEDLTDGAVDDDAVLDVDHHRPPSLSTAAVCDCRRSVADCPP